MEKTYSLSEIKSKVSRLAAQIDAPDDLLPTYGYSEDGARPHIEVDSFGYHYVVMERGQVIRSVTTNEQDELLYHIFEGITFTLACQYELKHRLRNQDFRRLMFQRQMELLSMLSPKWAEIEARDHEKILQRHPFDDHP